MNNAFFKTRAGNSSLGNQDAEVKALRLMGYTGTLNDMRRDFYRDITGIDDLTTATARSKDVAEFTQAITYAGKVNGDGDMARLMYYGTAGVEMAPSGFTSQVVSGYAGVSVEGDANVAYYQITTPANVYVQFLNKVSLSNYGTRDEVLKMLKSLRVRVKTHDATVRVWNPMFGVYDAAKTVSVNAGLQFVEFELIDNLNELVDTNNTIQLMSRTNVKSNGVNPLRLEIDFIEVIPTFFRQMP